MTEYVERKDCEECHGTGKIMVRDVDGWYRDACDFCEEPTNNDED